MVTSWCSFHFQDNACAAEQPIEGGSVSVFQLLIVFTKKSRCSQLRRATHERNAVEIENVKSALE